MTRHAAVVSVLLCGVLVASSAEVSHAQEQGQAAGGRRTFAGEPGRPGSFELMFGGEYLLSESLGSRDATIPRNNTGSSTFTYFSTSGSRQPAPAFRATIGYRITEMIGVEGGFLASRGDVRGSVTGDVENVPAATLTSSMTQYFIDATLVAHLVQMSFSGGAGSPYLEAGAGYLRQLQQGNAAVSTGQIYHVGGGVRYVVPTRPGRRLTGVGFRAGVRAYIPRNGFSFTDSQRTFVGVNGGLILTF